MAKKQANAGLTRRQIAARARNVTRKQAANYARRVSVGGKGG